MAQPRLFLDQNLENLRHGGLYFKQYMGRMSLLDAIVVSRTWEALCNFSIEHIVTDKFLEFLFS